MSQTEFEDEMDFTFINPDLINGGCEDDSDISDEDQEIDDIYDADWANEDNEVLEESTLPNDSTNESVSFENDPAFM